MTAALPLVLLPGLGCDGRVFAAQVADISSRRSVLVVRLPDGDTIPEIVAGLLRQMPPRFALAGLGLGGLIALQMASLADDRVDRLALLGVDARPEGPRTVATRDVETARIKAGLLRRVLTDDIAPPLVGTGPSRLAAQSIFVEMGIALGPDSVLAQSRLMARRPDMTHLLDDVVCPALVLSGEADRRCPPSRAELMATRLRQGRADVVAEAGHLAPIEAADAVTAALQRWLTDALVLT